MTNDDQQVARLDLLRPGDRDSLDDTRNWRCDRGLHLHRLNGCDLLAGGDLVAHLHLQGDDARERRGDLAGLREIRPLRLSRLNVDAPITYENRAELSVEGRHYRAHALGVRLADRLEPDVESHAIVDLNNVFRALAQTVQIIHGVDDR